MIAVSMCCGHLRQPAFFQSLIWAGLCSWRTPRHFLMDLRDECLPFKGETASADHISTTLLAAKPLSSPSTALKQGLAAGFKKVLRTEEDSPSPFPGLLPGILEMRVKEGSKIRNLMGFAMARMQSEPGDNSQSGLRQVVFTGSGRAVTKTITCAEIMKRKVGGLHQLTKLRYKGVQEVWESQEGGEAEMTVHRTVPSISILLSKDPLDPLEPGYQPPETQNALWEEREGADVLQPAGKRPFENTVSETQSKRFCPQGGVAL
ncbi:ribonuclease P protein subunit p25-like protein [Salminus brasiliensis]|uniref:ribonuclease P protein subunit p25-like protein n=1 Tax=Salminus brasiliensis TaxID=930266 RepID=UPI003B82F43F